MEFYCGARRRPITGPLIRAHSALKLRRAAIDGFSRGLREKYETGPALNAKLGAVPVCLHDARAGYRSTSVGPCLVLVLFYNGESESSVRTAYSCPPLRSPSWAKTAPPSSTNCAGCCRASKATA